MGYVVVELTAHSRTLELNVGDGAEILKVKMAYLEEDGLMGTISMALTVAGHIVQT